MAAGVRVVRRSLHERGINSSVDILVLQPAQVNRTVVFAVGAGGNPERHLPLLTVLVEDGCRIAAPYFERLTSPTPNAIELVRRATALRMAVDEACEDDPHAVGLGHSIGAALLLMLAGGQARTITGEAVEIEPIKRLRKLALMAPALDFFKAPQALKQVRGPIKVWAGGKDEITPPSALELLTGGTRVEIEMTAEAGHFSFMDAPPPHVTDTLPGRVNFLDRLASQVASYIRV